MNWRKKISPEWVPITLGVAALVLFAARCAPATTTNCPGIKITSKELSAAQADEYCRYAMQERSKVEAYWGATWTGPIRIDVSSKHSGFGHPLGFDERGSLQVAMPGMRVNTAPLVHQMVHVYAPNTNRFLAEGLAVYLQMKLGDDSGFPNFGEELAPLAARAVKQVGSLQPLDALRIREPFGTDPSDPPWVKSYYRFAAVDRTSAFIVAGSFVGYLIEHYGLAQFRTLYETWDYKKTYGKSLKTLEKEWRASLPQNQ